MGLGDCVNRLWSRLKNYSLAIGFASLVSISAITPHLFKPKDWQTQAVEVGNRVSAFCIYSGQKLTKDDLSELEDKLGEEGEEPILAVRSPDGTKIAYTQHFRTDSPLLHTRLVIDDGQEAKTIFESPKQIANIQWSKSGYIAFSTFGLYKHRFFETDEDHLGDDVYVYTNKLVNVTKSSSVDILVGWSDDENLIVASNRSGFGMFFDAYKISIDGGALTQLTNLCQDRVNFTIYANLLSCGVCLILGAAAYSRAKVYRKRLKYSNPTRSKPSLFDFLVSNAWLPAGLAGAYHLTQSLRQMPCFVNNPLVYSFLTQGGCTIGFIIYLMLDSLRQFKQPILKNMFRFGSIKKPKSLEMRIKIASQSRDALRFQKDDESYWLKTAEIYALQNDFQKSLYALQKAVKLANKYGVSTIAKADFSHSIASAFGSKPHSYTPTDLFISAFENAINFRHEKFGKYSSEALRLLEHEPLKRAEAMCCCATAYEFLGKRDAARQAREAAVKEILSLPDFDKFLGYIVSGHAVYELEFDDYARSTLVLKNAPEPVLGSEMHNLQRVAELIDKEKRINCAGFGVVRPWGIYGHQSKQYLVEERALGTILEAAFEKNFDVALLDLALKYQAFLHARMPRNSVHRNHEDDLKQALDSVKLTSALKQDTLGFCKTLFPIYGASCAFDCDGHRANRFIDEDGRIVGIDLESKGYIPPEFDLAKLLKLGPTVDQQVEQELLANYVSTIRWAKADIDVLGIERRVLAASPYKAIRYALYAADKPAHHSVARTFLFNAKKDLACLASSGAIPSGAAKHGEEVLKKVELHCFCNTSP